MLLLYVAGYVLTLLVCAPAWPIYNKHPLVWLDAIEDKKSDKESSHDETDEEEKR
jgi:signal peptidase complex subunit 1